MDCRTLAKARDGCEWFDGQQTCAGEVSLRFKFKLNTLGSLRIPLVENLKD